jgi:hypothetical protein
MVCVECIFNTFGRNVAWSAYEIIQMNFHVKFWCVYSACMVVDISFCNVDHSVCESI